MRCFIIVALLAVGMAERMHTTEMLEQDDDEYDYDR